MVSRSWKKLKEAISEYMKSLEMAINGILTIP